MGRCFLKAVALDLSFEKSKVQTSGCRKVKAAGAEETSFFFTFPSKAESLPIGPVSGGGILLSELVCPRLLVRLCGHTALPPWFAQAGYGQRQVQGSKEGHILGPANNLPYCLGTPKISRREGICGLSP